MENQNKQETKSHSLTSEFVPYEQALALKELGFAEPCFGYYVLERNGDYKLYDKCEVKTYFTYIEAPTFSQAFRWFREKYNLVHEISWSKYKGGVSFDYDVFSLVLPTDDELGNEDDIYIEKPMETYDSLAGKSFRDRDSDTFEEAELACLRKLIEIVESKQCSKNGIKKERESCTLNNNCIYPNCMK